MVKRTKQFISDFKQFALRGNLIDMAVGFTVGAGFSTIAKSLVDDMIMPPVGLLLGRADFSDFFLLLKPGTKALPPYANLADARAAGAVTLNYGQFINSVIAFMLVALAMYFIVRAMAKLDRELEGRFAKQKEESMPPMPDKQCPYCLSTIPYRAIKCGFCTSNLGH